MTMIKNKKIYFIWEYNEDNSFWIYSNNLIKHMKELNSVVDIYDKRVKIRGTWIFRIIIHLWNTMKNCFLYNWDSDVAVYIHSFQIIPPVFIKRNRIIIVHDLFYYDSDDQYTFFVKLYYKFHRFLYGLIFKNCCKIIAISNATKREIINKFGESLSNKIEIIYNWINLNLFHPDKTNKTSKFPYILYVWSEIERKNLKTIIESFSIIKTKIPNLKLVKAPWEKNLMNRKKTISYCERYNLSVWNDVILKEWFLPFHELVLLYQQAEIFLFPSFKEWFGFPILEAQACWCPVITTNYEPMNELVPYSNFTVDPYNAVEIANKIEEILSNKNLREYLINEWIEYSKKFSWEITAKNFIKLFESL